MNNNIIEVVKDFLILGTISTDDLKWGRKYILLVQKSMAENAVIEKCS